MAAPLDIKGVPALSFLTDRRILRYAPTLSESDNQSSLYRLLVENSLGLMCVHDLDGLLISINPAVAESLGYRPEDGPGRNLRDFLAPAVRSRFDDYLLRIQRNGKDTGVMRLLAQDGSERIWMYRNTLHERPGSPSWVLGHALDITRAGPCGRGSEGSPGGAAEGQ